MLRFLLLAGILILGACGSDPVQALTACEEHVPKDFSVPPRKMNLIGLPGIFDEEPSKAKLRFYLENWENALKRVTVSSSLSNGYSESTWSETNDYCLIISHNVKRHYTPKYVNFQLESYFNANNVYIEKDVDFNGLGISYVILYLLYERDKKRGYCATFEAEWKKTREVPPGVNQVLGESFTSVFGALCASKHRRLPPHAVETLLTHITYGLEPSDPPLDIGTMPIPQ